MTGLQIWRPGATEMLETLRPEEPMSPGARGARGGRYSAPDPLRMS